MAKSLIIVESPTKIKTYKNALGSGYEVEASMGHVRDLPEKKLGVDIEHDFAPTYETTKDRADVMKRLTAAAKGATNVYFASDPDREGEAIAWHLAEALKIKNPQRIQANELTKPAILHAIANPGKIDMDRVNAQQARRVLDRLVGYKLSPILWKKIQKGLSAGRVQSVAVRIICEREREIQAFEPVEYWSLTATLTPLAPEKRFPFTAKLHSRGGERLEPKSEETMDGILHDLEGTRYDVAEVKKREQRRNAAPPFITSTLQQEASRKLGFSNRRTMSVAQDLYEGIELGALGAVGLITYMRTDSVRIAAEAQAEAVQYIRERYDADPKKTPGYAYAPETPKQFKTKSSAQDAHEAIRPTSVYHEPDQIARFLSSDQLRLYRIIWQRFVASQMNPAVMDVTTADIAASQGNVTGAPYLFRSTGSIVKFDGFMRVYTEGKDTEEVTDEEQPPLPPLAKDQPLDLLSLEPKQHFTEPPPRYTEATIVKALDEQGIGRPSTWASIIQTIRDREYVELTEKRFYPTELGFKVNDSLVKHFPSVMDLKFTADMETKLDDVAVGKSNWVTLLHEFYDPFALQLTAAATEMESLKAAPVETEFHCPDTGAVMLLRQSRYGAFLGCSDYPKCKKILKLNEDGQPAEGLEFLCGLAPQPEKVPVDPTTLPGATDYVCPDGKGVMIQRTGRLGPFLGCSSYPKCRTLLNILPDGALKEGQEFKCTYSDAPVKAAKKTTRKTTTRGAAAKRTATTKAPVRRAGSTGTKGE
jgi:DNA topoisomerase-1